MDRDGHRPTDNAIIRAMRIIAVLLLLLLAFLQYRLWFGEGGLHDLSQLEQSIQAQADENDRFEQRNTRLKAEVEGLREPGDAIEELAREELGLVAEGEVFYQLIEGANTIDTDGDVSDLDQAVDTVDAGTDDGDDA